MGKENKCYMKAVYLCNMAEMEECKYYATGLNGACMCDNGSYASEWGCVVCLDKWATLGAYRRFGNSLNSDGGRQ